MGVLGYWENPSVRPLLQASITPLLSPMIFLKRIELWILLALIGGAVALVISTGGNNPADEPDRDGPPESASTPEAPFAIEASHLKRDYGNAILEIRLSYRNDTDAAIELSSPTARLLAGPDPVAPRGAEEVSAFFLAFAPPPSIPAGETSTVVLKYWLEKPHLQDALWLRIQDDILPVKSSEPLDFESIPDQESRIFTAPEWR